MQKQENSVGKRLSSRTLIQTPASSSIRKIVYSAKDKILEVELISGKIYQYFPVPIAGWEEIKAIVESGASVGTYYNLVVKNKYDNYRQVTL